MSLGLRFSKSIKEIATPPQEKSALSVNVSGPNLSRQKSSKTTIIDIVRNLYASSRLSVIKIL